MKINDRWEAFSWNEKGILFSGVLREYEQFKKNVEAGHTVDFGIEKMYEELKEVYLIPALEIADKTARALGLRPNSEEIINGDS